MSDMSRNVSSYTPTNTEMKIIEVLLNPAHRLKTITEVCDIVGCDRKTYQRAFDKPAFVEHYNALSMSFVQQSVGSVLNAFHREAVRGSFQHGKVILEMAGLYVEKKEVKVEHPERDLSDEELAKRVAEINKKLGYVKPE